MLEQVIASGKRLVGNRNALRTHISTSYRRLRLWMGVIAIAYPFALWGIGALHYNLPRAPSISAYYHHGCGVMQDWFVGGLFAVGVFLGAYKGYSRAENWLLNAAGLLAIAIAVVPMNPVPPPAGECPPSSAHGFASLLFFGCIAWVMLKQAKITLPLVQDALCRKSYAALYNALGGLMILTGIASYLINRVSYFCVHREYMFFTESLMVVLFGLYWLAKTFELWRSEFEKWSVVKEGKAIEKTVYQGDLTASREPRT